VDYDICSSTELSSPVFVTSLVRPANLLSVRYPGSGGKGKNEEGNVSAKLFGVAPLKSNSSFIQRGYQHPKV